MKDKEKQIFDKYGNYDFPTELKQEGLNNATSQIEEMARKLNTYMYPRRLSCLEDCKDIVKFILEMLLPKDSVVLSREDMKKYAKDCIAGQETGLDIINALIARAERYKEKAKQERKETAEKILKLVLNMAYFDLDGQLIFPVSSLRNYITNKLNVEIKE